MKPRCVHVLSEMLQGNKSERKEIEYSHDFFWLIALEQEVVIRYTQSKLKCSRATLLRLVNPISLWFRNRKISDCLLFPERQLNTQKQHHNASQSQNKLPECARFIQIYDFYVPHYVTCLTFLLCMNFSSKMPHAEKYLAPALTPHTVQLMEFQLSELSNSRVVSKTP